MATTSNLEITPSSPSSSQPSSWDVFLSFYGKDTRQGFISHLYKALDDAGFLTFRDDPALEIGEEISSGLLGAIRGSKMFVVVISENYARSSWCLDELVEILACKSRDNQVVPVFYYVDPSDLRHLKRSFGEAFETHEKRYSDDTLEKWKSALGEIAGLSGLTLIKDAKESEAATIEKIIDIVSQAFPKVLYLEEHLYGIDSAVEEIRQKLRMELDVVRAVGICGMGGIGKTARAKAFYNKCSNMFDISCFIDNVKQYSQGGSPLLPLLERLITELLRKKHCKVRDVASGIRQLKQILRSKKALIVLDDLDQSSYSEFLKERCNLFSAGSRIVVTTRDVNLLHQLKLDLSGVDIYMVKELEQNDSLELFSYHAFRKPAPPASLRELSVSFVTHAGGLPLALKVLGSLVHSNTDETSWKGTLEEIQKFPVKGIEEILQVSYDNLTEMQKAIFLDIAFFFVGKLSSEATTIFQSSLEKAGIRTLVDRCLLTIDKDNKLQMHNHIQDMGKDLGKSTRLSWKGDTWNDLRNQEGIDKIECLILDLTQSREKQINPLIFQKMPNLRLLEIINAGDIKGDFKNSFHDLRSFRWSYCPWTQIPSQLKAQKLVYLEMPNSNFNTLWNGESPFESLKVIDVTNSVNLKMTPDFRNSKLIERLIFRGCEGLVKLDPSIRELTGLFYLDLRECTHLKELDEPIGQLTIGSPEPVEQWANMVYLKLDLCTNLRRLPEQLGDMKCLKVLDASQTAIKELPDSITQLKGLVQLYLSNCKKLRKLPQYIGNMEGLKNFSARNTAIEQLPDSFAGLINLEYLDLINCQKLRNLPNDIWKLSLLKYLLVDGCSKLEQLPAQLGSMLSLEFLHAGGSSIEKVPDSVAQLSRLKYLNLFNCKNLKYVPDSIWNLESLIHLYLIGRINFPNTVKDIKLVDLSLNCDIRLWLPTILSFSSLENLRLRDEGESLSSTEPFSLSKLHNLRSLELYSFGSSFLELPPSLTHLILCDNATLVHLPDVSSLKHLKKLDIIKYTSLESLPPLPPHLQSLTVHHCRSLHNLPNMSILKELVFLSFGRCSSLEFFRRYPNYLEIAGWFSYKSIGRRLQLNIPPLLRDDFLGLALWVRFTSKNSYFFSIIANVTNKTNGLTTHYGIPVACDSGADIYSVVRCIRADEILIRSGDSIQISFERQLYSFLDADVRGSYEEVKMEMCGAHVIQKSTITPNFQSFFNNLITGV